MCFSHVKMTHDNFIVWFKGRLYPGTEGGGAGKGHCPAPSPNFLKIYIYKVGKKNF
jgi:hypothetical protein